MTIFQLPDRLVVGLDVAHRSPMGKVGSVGVGVVVAVVGVVVVVS